VVGHVAKSCVFFEAGWLRLEPGDGADIWTDEVAAVLKRLGPDPTRPDPTTLSRRFGPRMNGA